MKSATTIAIPRTTIAVSIRDGNTVNPRSISALTVRTARIDRCLRSSVRKTTSSTFVKHSQLVTH